MNTEKILLHLSMLEELSSDDWEIRINHVVGLSVIRSGKVVFDAIEDEEELVHKMRVKIASLLEDETRNTLQGE